MLILTQLKTSMKEVALELGHFNVTMIQRQFAHSKMGANIVHWYTKFVRPKVPKGVFLSVKIQVSIEI
jgi:hypothetical protein